MNTNGQPVSGGSGSANADAVLAGLERLPYFKEYVSQIVQPRVKALVEQLEARLEQAAWVDVLERMSAEQGGGLGSQAAGNPEVLLAMLQQTLGLKLTVKVQAVFEPGAIVPTSAAQQAEVVEAVRTARAVDSTGRTLDATVERRVPDNPLLRALSVRKTR